ncbi:MAG: IS91 family transposase [Tissierellales bacterium]|nr:IS91 family transposase [Tissierellales bacterium]
MEVADVFRLYAPSYKKSHSLPMCMHKAMNSIIHCRTQALGGHVYRCDRCGYERPFYNSYRNRHCPKCGSLAKERWLLARKKDVLPVVYFHVVFTIPDILNPLVLMNQRVMYNILLRAGSETLLELGRDRRHLGAHIGMIAVLHTWSQNLMDHPHLHCIVTGGGLSENGKRWVYPKKLKDGASFFVHVNVLSELFKKKFMAYLKEAQRKGQLKYHSQTTFSSFKQLKNELYKKKWVVYCKEPFSGAESVLEYLGRYVYRVAISNRRLVKMENDRVVFTWRDYRDDKKKVMSLDAFEFIRRFLLHVLPEGFFKIRYYGILASRNLKTKLKKCKEILQVRMTRTIEKIGWVELFFKLTGIDLTVCPQCKTGRMVRLPLNHSPP